jgi:hypothetical protein
VLALYRIDLDLFLAIGAGPSMIGMQRVHFASAVFANKGLGLYLLLAIRTVAQFIHIAHFLSSQTYRRVEIDGRIVDSRSLRLYRQGDGD